MTRDISTLAEAIQNGDRRALARGITLVESDRSDHREDANTLLEMLAKGGKEALRIVGAEREKTASCDRRPLEHSSSWMSAHLLLQLQEEA